MFKIEVFYIMIGVYIGFILLYLTYQNPQLIIKKIK